MKFLIDNGLPPRLADLLRASGYDAVHVRACEMQEAADREILARALDGDRIVVSADSDFSTILASQEAERPSFILFRETNVRVARDYLDLLLSALPVLETELMAGCVAVFRNGSLRVRKLLQNCRVVRNCVKEDRLMASVMPPRLH